MFTGMIDHCGCVVGIESHGHGRRFYIETQYIDISMGESIAVDGICLTAVEYSRKPSGQNQFAFDLSPETLTLTHAVHLKEGSFVNLERSLTMADRLNGHFVMGHVDQTAVILAKTVYEGYVAFKIAGVLQEAWPFLVKKGCIAINGVSLTINEMSEDNFEVMLIPETLRRTNLGQLEPQGVVNIEYDYLAKIIAQQTRIITSV